MNCLCIERKVYFDVGHMTLIKLLFLVIFQIVCIFGSCMPRSNHLLTVPEARSAMQSQTNFTTDLCYLCPSVRPSVWRVRS